MPLEGAGFCLHLSSGCCGRCHRLWGAMGRGGGQCPHHRDNPGPTVVTPPAPWLLFVPQPPLVTALSPPECHPIPRAISVPMVVTVPTATPGVTPVPMASPVSMAILGDTRSCPHSHPCPCVLIPGDTPVLVPRAIPVRAAMADDTPVPTSDSHHHPLSPQTHQARCPRVLPVPHRHDGRSHWPSPATAAGHRGR